MIIGREIKNSRCLVKSKALVDRLLGFRGLAATLGLRGDERLPILLSIKEFGDFLGFEEAGAGCGEVEIGLDASGTSDEEEEEKRGEEREWMTDWWIGILTQLRREGPRAVWVQ